MWLPHCAAVGTCAKSYQSQEEFPGKRRIPPSGKSEHPFRHAKQPSVSRILKRLTNDGMGKEVSEAAFVLA